MHLLNGTKIDVIAKFDNSAANPYNPDPTKEVHWGEQTFVEMMMGYFGVVVDADKVPASRVRNAEPPLRPVVPRLSRRSLPCPWACSATGTQCPSQGRAVGGRERLPGHVSGQAALPSFLRGLARAQVRIGARQ